MASPGTKNLARARFSILSIAPEYAPRGFAADLTAVGSLLHLTFASMADTAPPAAPESGETYRVAAASTGAWSGHDGQIAVWYYGWNFIAPAAGMSAWNVADATRYDYDGAAWNAAVGGGGGGGVPTSRAINTTAPLTGGGNLTADRTLAISTFVASGGSHARGAVPDPGASAGSTKFLREDASWNVPAYPVSSVAGRTGAVTLSSSDVGLGSVSNVAQEPAITAGSTSQYWRGDKSWQTLNTTAVSGLGTAATKNADNSANNLPLLDGSGKLASSVLPSLAINDTFVVASQVAMLALSAQRGDVAVRSDQHKVYILAVDDPTTLGNWQELTVAGEAPVQSVNGTTGSVVLTTSNVTEGSSLYFTTGRASAAAPVQSVDGLGGTVSLPAFVASGASHAAGKVPDPGSSAGTAKFLREDATWVAPASNGQASLSFATFASEASATVIQTGLATTSKIHATVYADGDDVYAQDWDPPIIRNVTGSGFDVVLRPKWGTFKGTVKVNWSAIP